MIYDGRNGIDTCSSKDQYPFRIKSRPQGRTACSAPSAAPSTPIIVLALAKQRYAVHSMALLVQGEKGTVQS